MTNTPNLSLKWLDEISFGLSRLSGMGASPTITIELERKVAERLLLQITKELEEFLKDYLRPMPIIMLGSVFQYRGVNFRVVEKASQ